MADKEAKPAAAGPKSAKKPGLRPDMATLLGLALVWLVRLRRRRDEARRARLDEGWVIPEDDEPTA